MNTPEAIIFVTALILAATLLGSFVGALFYLSATGRGDGEDLTFIGLTGVLLLAPLFGLALTGLFKVLT